MIVELAQCEGLCSKEACMAWRSVRRLGSLPELVILDLMLPDVSGFELLANASEFAHLRDPGLRTN